MSHIDRTRKSCLTKETGVWVYRRNSTVKRAIEDCFLSAEKGHWYLKPEIQLLYKSAHPMLEKNRLDFEQAVDKLDDVSKDWLFKAITAITHGDHPWLK